jgi:hypothetical protein
MKTLLIILGVLVLLALIPLGAHVRYDSDGPWVALVIGPIKIRLIPKKPKKPKKPKAEKKKKEKKKKPEKPKKEKEKQPLGGLIRDFYPFVKLGLDLLGCFFRKLRIPILTLHVGFGGQNDPAGAAINYGRAWSAIGAVMQPVRSLTRIKKENVSCSCDFTTGDMRVFAELKAVFLLGDLVAMAVRYGFRALRQYLKLKKSKKKKLPEKGGAKNESSSS